MQAVILGDRLVLRQPEPRLMGPQSYQTVIEALNKAAFG